MLKRRCIMNALLIFFIFLTACGTESVSNSEASPIPETVYDWKVEGLITESILKESFLYTVDYEKIEYTMPENAIGADHIQVTCDGVYYVLDQFYTGRETVCSFRKISIEEESPEPIMLTPDMWGIPDGHILGMDVVNPGQCVFWVASDYAKVKNGKQEAQHYYIVYTDSLGNQQESTDIIETLQEQGIWESANITYVGTQICCDAQGNLYLFDQNSHVIYLLDREGRLITSYSDPAGEEGYFIQGIHTSSGEVFFACGSWDEREFIWLDPETGAVKRLADTVTEFREVLKWYGLYGDVIYYATRNQLIGWKISTGEKTVLVDLVDNAIASATDTSLLVQGENIKLLSTEVDKRYVLTFSTEEPVIAADITFVNICSESSGLAGRVAGFSREYPLYAISYQDMGDRERVLAEVMNGSGPDILYVTREDMENLQANGALGDLGQMLSQETLDILLPGVLKMGTYDDKLMGLPTSVYFRSMMTSKLYWQEEFWTIEDVLSILKEKEELKGIFTDFFGQDQYFYNLYYLLGMDIEHSPFIVDWKGRFDSPEFKEVLSWVKKKTNNKDGFDYSGTIVQNASQVLRDGDYLGVEVQIYDMHSFGSYYVGMGEDFQLVGYPTETGKGSYMWPNNNGMIIVNQNAVGKEGIKELLEYLFSLESQQYLTGNDGISIRLDIPESQLRYYEDSRQYFWINPGGDMVLLPGKKDKSSYLDEYVDFIRNAVPYPVHSDELFNIVMEEADSYFSSNKNLDEVAQIIQNKVQLYLDEHQ